MTAAVQGKVVWVSAEGPTTATPSCVLVTAGEAPTQDDCVWMMTIAPQGAWTSLSLREVDDLCMALQRYAATVRGK